MQGPAAGSMRSGADNVGIAGVLIRAAAVTVPVRVQICTSGRHFAVLTINMPVGLNRDHLFLVREGTAKRKSWKFKVVHSRPLFGTGTMAGLIILF